MKIKILTLRIQCRESVETIQFSPRVTFFHGKTGAGKSSIARMVDFCLGGDLEKTPAVRKEVLNISLAAELGSTSCVLERETLDKNYVHVSWKDLQNKEHHTLAPIRAGDNPILGDSVFNLSDLIFHFCGITPIKVRKSKSEEGSPLIRLSFRDLMWYCYLEQDKLDSSFYRLKEPILESKSRDVMRFILGYYTERLQELDLRLEQIINEREAKLQMSHQMRLFLDNLGYGSEQQILQEINVARTELEAAQRKRDTIQGNFHADTHSADNLRNQLRSLSNKLGEEEQVLSELQKRVDEQSALKAELTSARFKLARMESASSVLKRVEFTSCPVCGMEVTTETEENLHKCPLCKSDPAERPIVDQAADTEIAKRDIESRISDLEESLDRARKAVRRQSKGVESLRKDKAILDQQLVQELLNYDSVFVAAVRELDRKTATLTERLKGLDRLKQLPEAIEQLLREVDQSKAEEEQIRRAMENERHKLTTAGEVIRKVEDTYVNTLLKVGVPGVRTEDIVQINRKNWIPFILEGGNKDLGWSFFDTGSGGKKTLLNICYAMSIHVVAEQRQLPLPRFLIIDTPMKNISEDVNRNLFEAFYHTLYGLIQEDLASTQVIIIDKEFISPPEGIEIIERFMTPDDPFYPPLISYYRGP